MGYFDTVADLVKMGSHGAFVWSVYGVTLLALLWQAMSLRQLRRRVTQRARHWHAVNRRESQ